MKKPIQLLSIASIAILSLASSAFAQSQQSWDYYWSKNEPDRTLTPYYSTPEQYTARYEGRSAYFGVEGAYGFNTRNSGIDMAGGYLTYNAYDDTGSNRSHQFAFQAGLFKGNRTYTWDGIPTKNAEKQYPLTLGYTYNLAVHDRILLYGGFKGGIVFGQHKRTSDVEYHRSSNVGALFGFNAGVKFIVTPRMDVILGYEFQRNFIKYHGDHDYNGYHFLKAGVSFGF